MSYHDGKGGDKTPSINPPMTKAELRKCQKPIMEKRRRARINSCLNELKSLILEAMKKDPSRHTKLEKADILELTVKHLQNVQNQQLSMAINVKPTIVEKFKTGFSDCAEEVLRYVNRMEDIDSGIKQRLTNHLDNCINNLQSFGGLFDGLGSVDAAGLGAIYNRFFNETLKMAQHSTAPMNIPPTVQAPVTPIIIQDNNNNNNRIQMNGVQLIPSRLPSGEFALVVPNSNQNATYFTGESPVSSVFDLSMPRVSAFNVILKENRSTPVSPPLSPVSTSNEANTTQATPLLQIHINQQNIGETYPTPPNENLLMKTVAGQSQYPQISSSTMEIKIDPNDSGLGESFKRRSLENDEEEFQIKKRMKVEPIEQRKEESADSMWRPW